MTDLGFVYKAASRGLLAVYLLTTLSFAVSDPKVDAGENVFKSHCIWCHGTDATGNTALGKQLKARNLRSAIVQKKTNAELKHIITAGEGNMPAFSAQLSSAQIDEVLAYVRQLGKSRK